MDLGLAGKRVLIAGGSRGIGRCLVRLFHSEGCHVAFCARDASRVHALAREIDALGDRLLPYALDVTDADQFTNMAQDVCRHWAGLDIFIWNISAQSDDWATGFETDIRACVTCTECIIPMLNAQGAAVIAIASRVASIGIPGNKAYAALKAALVHYMTSLSLEHGERNIRINCLSPSEVYSEDTIWGRLKISDPEKYQRALTRSRLGRMASPQEVAQAAVFLASPAASYIAGINLVIDGGSHIHVNY